MRRAVTIKIRKRGVVTLPAKLLAKYGLRDGDPVTIVDLDGVFLITPRVLTVPRLARGLERSRRTRGLRLTDLRGRGRPD
jgi:bifunctional DNA-binding transcriptional regulator/antitoxin component of YhaV-PrlF toxin-antitoxin module